jgi:hypothetical protein
LSFIPLLTARTAFIATGGTIYTQGGYTYHKFEDDGTFEVLSGQASLQVLAVGGGGAGGRALTATGSNYSYGGGGGAGGIELNTIGSISLSITIGAGGLVGGSSTGPSSGGQTSVYTIPPTPGPGDPVPSPAPVLIVGGGGYGSDPSLGLNAANGTSGGGAGIKRVSSVITNYTAGTGNGVTGFNGGTVISGTGASAGGGHGGGFASAGGSGPLAGGLGTSAYSSWFDVGGYDMSNGGNGGRLVADFVIQDYGTGGQGGASYYGNTYTPANGADGVVVVRYAV